MSSSETFEIDDDIVPINDDGIDEETAEDKRRAEWLDSAQEMLDFLDEHRDLIPTTMLSVSRYSYTPEGLAENLRSLGTAEKIASDYRIGARRRFGVHEVEVVSPRESTCTKVPTGETESKTLTVAASETVPVGARNVRTITQVVYEVDEPVTEWSCPPSLLHPGAEDIPPENLDSVQAAVDRSEGTPVIDASDSQLAGDTSRDDYAF